MIGHHRRFFKCFSKSWSLRSLRTIEIKRNISNALTYAWLGASPPGRDIRVFGGDQQMRISLGDTPRHTSSRALPQDISCHDITVFRGRQDANRFREIVLAENCDFCCAKTSLGFGLCDRFGRSLVGCNFLWVLDGGGGSVGLRWSQFGGSQVVSVVVIFNDFGTYHPTLLDFMTFSCFFCFEKLGLVFQCSILFFCSVHVDFPMFCLFLCDDY